MFVQLLSLVLRVLVTRVSWLCTQIAWFLEPLILDLRKQPIPKQDHGLLVECAAGGDQWNHR